MITHHKPLFRFLLIFFGLLTFPFPIYSLFRVEFIGAAILDLYHIVIPWIGKHILHLEKEITEFSGGSGDTTYDYVLVLFFLVLAIIGAAIWSALDRSKRNYEQLNYWFLVLLRYYVGYMMLSYGMAKVIPMQFSEPSFFRLLQPYGDSSPMGLAWTFIGASKAYTIFSGLAEVIGGILLFHRKTVVLGGLILVSVLTNIVLMNFCYDVPVKLFSLQLLIMVLILLAPHLKRLFAVILFNRPTITIAYQEPFTKPKWLKAKHIIKWIVVGLFVYFNVTETIKSSKEYGPDAPKPPLYGLYEVTDFTINSKEVAPLITDTIRWRYLEIEYENYLRIYRTDMSRKGYTLKVDTTAQKMELTHRKDSTKVYTLNYTKTDSTMHVKGILHCDTIDCKTKRIYKNDFLLINRGFRWINEKPFNR